jgi:hypothetical protein
MELLNIIGEVAIGLVVFLIMLELIQRFVFGRFATDEELAEFLTKHLQEYKENTINDHMLYGSSYLPYISRIDLGILSRWYIASRNQIGTDLRIKRTSNWNKVLDRIVKDSLVGKKLTDL